MSVFKDDQTTYTGNMDVLGSLNVHGDLTVNGSDWSSALTAYTPTVTTTGGNFTTATISGRYKQIGKVIVLQTQLTITTVGPASGDIIISLPANAAAFYYVGSSISVSSGKSGYTFINGAGTPTVMAARDSTFTSYIGAGAIVATTSTYEAA